MSGDTSYNICFANVRGLNGSLGQTNGTYQTNRISSKIQELVSFNNYGTPTLYALLETKLKPSKNSPKLPNHLRYIGETSNASGGILLYADKTLNLNAFHVIHSKHAVFVKLNVNNRVINKIIVYLPSELRECLEVLQNIENFLERENIVSFCIYGDFNIDFCSKSHLTKAKKLLNFLEKFNLFDLTEKLNCKPDFTWHALRNGKLHTSSIDHFFTNMPDFSSIKFQHNSFSDHKHAVIASKKPFIYSPPRWKPFLFNKVDFIELLKKETISFLVDMADPGCLKNTKDFYLNNPSILDTDLEFSKLEYHETSAFFDLLTHLKKHHDKYFSKQKLANFEKVKDFDKSMADLINKIKCSPDSTQITEQIADLTHNQQAYFKHLVYSNAEFKIMQRIQADGGNNSYTYRHIKKSRRSNYKLKINNKIINCPKECSEIFSSSYAKIVSPEVVPHSNLGNLLDDYDISLEQIFPKINNLTDPFSNTAEFKTCIKSMKSTSAPGNSSQPKHLFLFLINFLPSFVTKALNNLYLINIDDSPFKYIKDRNIIYIPKKGFDLSLPEHFRPISLLEIVYKIISKALNRKLCKYLDRIVHSQQFGFVPHRHMANASLNITTAINKIVKDKTDAQIISFDFSRAFDTVLNSVIEEILFFIFPVGTFAKAFTSLTKNGRFRSFVNGFFSGYIKYKRGCSQGDPPSGSKFIILNHIFIALLESKSMKHIFFKIGKAHLRPKSYADDNLAITQIKNETDVFKLKNLLTDLEKGLGLCINFNKTKILVFGTFPQNLSSIGQIVDKLKHLGIFLSFDLEYAREQTYLELCSKLERKACSMPMQAGFNILKRRNLCISILTSLGYHIFRVYPPGAKFCSRLSKIFNKFLWSIRKPDGSIKFRHKIAKNRIEQDLVYGGLKMLQPEQQSFSIFINSFMNCLKYTALHQDTTISILFAHKHLPISSLLKTFSYQTLLKYINIFKAIYPCNGGEYFDKAINFFHDLEKNKNTFLHSPILTSHFSNIFPPFNKRDEIILEKANKITIASILETREFNNRLIFLPLLKFTLYETIPDLALINKLKNIVKAVGTSVPNTSFNRKKSTRLLFKPLSVIQNEKKSIYSLHFKHMHRERIAIQHPAIKTRIKDNISFPDEELFYKSYNKLLSMPIMLHFKNLFLEQINRTLTSKNKLFKFKLVETNLCVKCKCVSTTEHEIFDCIFPKFFIHKLALFLDCKYNQSRPEFIFLKENFYLYNMYYEDFSNNDYIQLSHLILASKDRSLKISKENKIVNWNENNLFAHSILLTQFTFKLLAKAGLENDLIANFLNFLTQ